MKPGNLFFKQGAKSDGYLPADEEAFSRFMRRELPRRFLFVNLERKYLHVKILFHV